MRTPPAIYFRLLTFLLSFLSLCLKMSHYCKIVWYFVTKGNNKCTYPESRAQYSLSRVAVNYLLCLINTTVATERPACIGFVTADLYHCFASTFLLIGCKKLLSTLYLFFRVDGKVVVLAEVTKGIKALLYLSCLIIQSCTTFDLKSLLCFATSY